MGCFSFYPGKNLFCFGEGGSVTSDNESYIDTINVLKIKVRERGIIMNVWDIICALKE